MRLPRVAVTAALIAAVTVPAVSTTAAASARPAHRPAAAKSPGKHAKPVRHVFAAAGSIVAVDNDGATITVAATAGTKDVKGRTVTMAVPTSARILVGGRRTAPAALQQWYRITVTGTRIGTAYTAGKIQATAPRPSTRPHPTPTPTTTAPDPATPSPGESVEPATSSEPAEIPGDDPSVEPTP